MKIIETINKKEDSLFETSARIGSFIGQTPLFRIANLSNSDRVRIYAKIEWQQFGGSVKSRPAYRIVDDAIKKGNLTRGKSLLDASSGNTGIAYAHIGASLGIPVTLCLPENASEERKRILKALNVTIHLTPAEGGTDEAQEVAKQLREDQPDKYFYADQYSNPSNWKAHYDTTGPEILDQTDYEVTHFITGLGTTGTFMGTGKRLKEYNPDVRLISLQPDLAMHGLEGWKHMETAHVPEIYDPSLADENRTVSTKEAYEILKQAAKKEGLLLSPSSAANLASALNLAEEIEEGVIVTVFPDDGNKYGEVIQHLY